MLTENEIDSAAERASISYKISIDFGFIDQLESSTSLTGYVPDTSDSQSGVFIAKEFDLGLRTPCDLRSLSLNPTLIGKLYPYLGLTGFEAAAYLEHFPLTIAENEANAIDLGHKFEMAARLCERYNEDSETVFVSLPACWQTVIASVDFQYNQLSERCPRFWSYVTQQNWQKALQELRGFGDNYSTRRNKEADYIEQHLAN